MSQISTRRTDQLMADAAVRVITWDGFGQASIRSVATEAGLAAGTVQHHFSSRDAILVGAFNQVLVRELQRTMSLDQGDIANKPAPVHCRVHAV